jgi:hypothetical protein
MHGRKLILRLFKGGLTSGGGIGSPILQKALRMALNGSKKGVLATPYLDLLFCCYRDCAKELIESKGIFLRFHFFFA